MAAEVGTSDDGHNGDNRLQEAIYAVILGLAGFLAIQVGALAVVLAISPVVGNLSDLGINVVAGVGTGLGAVAFTWLYLDNSRHDVSFLDLDAPRLSDAGYVVGGIVLLTGVWIGISVLATTLGVSFSEHSLAEQARQGDASLLLLMVPISILFIGPGEELVFRNVVQKRLTETFQTWTAIGITSLVFGAIHFSAYATDPLPQIVPSLAIVFALSIILGWLYARTERLIVPAVAHGCYNALQFLLLYVDIASV
ncbi:CPBP family intramembrane glutamic endopeptidase [Salinarchaeum laminariae]|uniref:CPBP family intramembrane glutamic endopeptidase n=1 Tax=Salinarchaeum laminariae TaxID=869888 RepID=UPI0020C0ED8C|nr:type II CAAX endopeptidase family protein [Salinarchaeum laminariae]